MRAAFPGTEGEWMGALIVALLLGVVVVVASVAERRRAWHRRRQRSRLRGFIRHAGGWEEWDRGL
jgi:hypothetical protein